MKKFMTNIKTLAALLIAGAAMTACSSSDDNIANEQPVNPATQKYIMTVNASKGDGATTRALTLDGSTLNASWATTENVYVKKGTNWVTGSLQPQTAGATANLTGVLSGTNIAAGDALTLQFPKKSAITFEGQTGTIADIEANYDYATANVTVASVANGQISVDGTTTFQNHQAIIKFTLLDKADGTTELNPSAFTITDGTNTVELTSIPEATYTANSAGVLYVAFPATNSAETVTLTATVGSDTYTYTTSSAKTFTNGNYYAITVKMTKAAPVEPVAVDMGLSSGTKWANMNLGANSPEDIGDYYAWGETEPYYSSQNPLTWKAGKEAGYDWASYTKFGTHDNSISPESGFNKYNTTDGKYVLEAADDAATANWGNGWRMPTKEEVNELLAAYPINSASGSQRRAWLENYNGTGVNGLAFYNASDNILLFLPASGAFNGTTLGSALCSYWSSTLLHGGANSEYASALVHNSTKNYSTNSFLRFQGRSIRPVK